MSPFLSHALRLTLLCALFAGAGGVAWLWRDVTNEKIAALEGEVRAAQSRINETRELLALIAEGNQDLRVQLKAEELRRKSTEETLQEIAKDKDALASKINTIKTELSEELAPVDLSRVIDEWSTRVGRIECLFTLSGGTRAKSVGSAVLTREKSGPVFLTNGHVITGQANLVPDSCTVVLPQSGKKVAVDGARITLSPAQDLARIPAEALTDTAPLPTCDKKPALGAPLVILGYPSVGSGESVTATEGIISGFDRGLYVTSAKIERGNSGGAAVNLKDNCFLGIPTLVVVGEIESLARIMPVAAP